MKPDATAPLGTDVIATDAQVAAAHRALDAIAATDFAAIMRGLNEAQAHAEGWDD